jgi:hypothetical protein
MDTYREYLRLNEMWQSGNAPLKIWEDGDGIWQAGSAQSCPRRAVDRPLPLE